MIKIKKKKNDNNNLNHKVMADLSFRLWYSYFFVTLSSHAYMPTCNITFFSSALAVRIFLAASLCRYLFVFLPSSPPNPFSFHPSSQPGLPLPNTPFPPLAQPLITPSFSAYYNLPTQPISYTLTFCSISIVHVSKKCTRTQELIYDLKKKHISLYQKMVFIYERFDNSINFLMK